MRQGASTPSPNPDAFKTKLQKKQKKTNPAKQPFCLRGPKKTGLLPPPSPCSAAKIRHQLHHRPRRRQPPRLPSRCDPVAFFIAAEQYLFNQAPIAVPVCWRFAGGVIFIAHDDFEEVELVMTPPAPVRAFRAGFSMT